MDERPRFYVIETRGFSGTSGRSEETSSFAVLDRRYCHRETSAGRFYVHHGGWRQGEAQRRAAAEALAAELNEWDRAARCA